MTGFVKALDDTVPLGQVVFFRSLFAMIPLVAFLRFSGDLPAGLATTRPWSHVVRCGLGISAMFTSFATIRLLPVAEATTLSFLAPGMVVVLAAWLLGERARPRRWAGVGLGMAGVLALTGPHVAAGAEWRTLIGIALGLLTAVLTAGALVQIRNLTNLGESAGAIAFYFALTGVVAGLFTASAGWVRPDPAQFAMLIGAGVAGGLAHILMTVSYRHAEAGALAPFEYLSVLWAVLMGLVFFAEPPGAGFLVAAPLIITGAIVATPRTTSTRPQPEPA
jgi:drug/metabolite transporter (DMT)-like permease